MVFNRRFPKSGRRLKNTGRVVPLLMLLCVFLLNPTRAFAAPSIASGANTLACTGIITEVTKSTSLRFRKMKELEYPSCFAPASVGIQAIDHAINHATMLLVSATRTLAVSVFFFIAVPLVIILGARIALGVESGVALPLGRAVLTLALAYGGIYILPNVVNDLIATGQYWGSSVSKGMTSSIQIDMQQNPIFTSSPGASNPFSALIAPTAVNLDPISILKMGVEDAAALITAKVDDFPHGGWTGLLSLSGFEAGLEWLVWAIIAVFAAVGLLFVFAYLGAKALGILLRAHVFIAYAPIMAALHALRVVKSGPYSEMYSMHRVISLSLRETMKLFILYTTIPILLAFQVMFINMTH